MHTIFMPVRIWVFTTNSKPNRRIAENNFYYFLVVLLIIIGYT